MQVTHLGASGEPVNPAYLRAMALQTCEIMLAGPEVPTADQVAEHLRKSGAGAAIVADESTTPADVDALIDTMINAGWTLAPDAEYVGGKRVRYLVPPEAVAADLFVRRETDLPAGVSFRMCVLHGADCKPTQNGRPCLGMQERGVDQDRAWPGGPTMGTGNVADDDVESLVFADEGIDPVASDPDDRDPYVGHGADGARRSADIDRAEADTYDTGSEAWQRCRSSADRWDEQAARIEAREGADELPEGVTLLGAGDLVDVGGYLGCGCHGSARDHSCGPSAGDRS